MLPLRVVVLVAALVVAGLTGCARDAAEVSEKAKWLCQHGQLSKPSLDGVPTGSALSDYLRPEDIQYLTAKEDTENKAESALAKQLSLVMAPIAAAMAERMAAHTRCAVEPPAINGESATMAVTMTRPKLDERGWLARLGKLTGAPDDSARHAAIDEWIKTSADTETASYVVDFVKTPAGWRANLNLQGKEEEARRAAVLTELKELRAKKEAGDKAAAELGKFAVTRAQFRTVKTLFQEVPHIELAVRNGTGHAISQVYMQGTLASPGRSVPWLRAGISYAIPGGLEPGEAAEWKLEPNMLSDWWKVQPVPEMVLTIDVVRLDGADGKRLYENEFTTDDQQRLVALEAALSK